jgi:D-glycero-D-manno-heptose 1,7-bisphosphate phosphatase
MIEDLLLSWPIERDKSFLIGDRETDLQAAKAAGVTAHLFNTPRLDLFLEQILHA